MAIKEIRRFLKIGEKGQGMTEYIIMLGLVAIAAIGIYSLFGKQIRQTMTSIGGQLAGKDTTKTTEVTDMKGEADKKATLQDFGGQKK